MLFILCPFCHARIDIDETDAARLQQRLTATCGECGEAFYFEHHEASHEPESPAIA